MNNIGKLSLSTLALLILAIGICAFRPSLDVNQSQEVREATNVLKDPKFRDYWYNDKAEIRTYALTQARYGEYHEGMATVIFVTEPFLEKEGVKPDSYKNTSKHTPVLKMNFLKKFGTGIYPYSMMLSTFTPLKETQGMSKASASGQEWCGHIFSQMNRRNNNYNVVSYSYFEEEGDQQFTLPTIFTEDEIWSRIRIDHKNLPTGEIDIIPGLYYTRLEQHQFEAEKANAELTIGKEESVYKLTYPKRDRTLEITFNAQFPHEIVKWEETYADKRAPDKKLTTTAVLNQAKSIDYWNYNAEKYKSIRKELGVPY